MIRKASERSQAEEEVRRASMKYLDLAASKQLEPGPWKHPKPEVDRRLKKRVTVAIQKRAPSNEEIRVHETQVDEVISAVTDDDSVMYRVQPGAFVEVRRYVVKVTEYA